MINEEFRVGLKVACRFFGGQTAVANAAGIDNSTLGKWLNGRPTLSPENIDAVLRVMGLPEGKPDASRVHIWKVNRVQGIDFRPALKLYFPDGGEIGRSAWKLPDWSYDTQIESFKNAMYVYAMRSGHVRGVLRHHPKYGDDADAILVSHLTWRHGSERASQLRILQDFYKWTAGTITKKDFDLVWEGIGLSPDAQSLITAIEAKGISYEEAIRRIWEAD